MSARPGMALSLLDHRGESPNHRLELTGAAMLVFQVVLSVLRPRQLSLGVRPAWVNRGMWYLAEILFAEPRHTECQAYQCEACNVVFDAATAREAYRKAMEWGKSYATEPPAQMHLLGVSHLTSIGDHLGDGIEICGRFFETPNVWDRAGEFIPAPESLKAIVWEQNQGMPVGGLLTPEQIAALKRGV
jgi:hypothetical protein